MAIDERDEILRRLTNYVRLELLGEVDGQVGTELSADTPLLQWGILNSMNTARLIVYLRDEMDADVSPAQVTGRHFHSLNTVTDLVLSLPNA